MNKANRIHWFLGTLLMMTFFLINTLQIFAAQTAGIIDSADESSVRGWALNSSDPDTAAEVKIIISNQADGQVVEEFTAAAGKYREDLTSHGTGNYGFEISVPWSSYGDGTYLVEAYSCGQKLSGTKVHPVGTAAANLSGSSSNLRSLGAFKTTAYCPCRKCSGGWGGRTSTGTIATANHTISVDPRIIPYGSRIMINGVVYTAEDCGGGVKGNHIDIFFNTHAETRSYGTRSVDVYLVQ